MIKYMIVQIEEVEQVLNDIGSIIFTDSPIVYSDVITFVNRALKQYSSDGCFTETTTEDTAYFMMDIVPYVERLIDTLSAYLTYHAIHIIDCSGIEVRTTNGVILMYFGGVTHGDISRYQSV